MCKASRLKSEFGSFWVLQTSKLNAGGVIKGDKVVTALQAESWAPVTTEEKHKEMKNN